MKKLAYIILIECYADWELGFLAPMFHEEGSADATWQAQTVSLTSEPIRSMGGLTVTPDLGLEDVTDNFDALILIGGTTWRQPQSQAFTDLVIQAMYKDVPVAAICDAASFLGYNGFLDEEINGWRESFRVGEKEYWGG